ncbi:hypothetical protein Q7C23_01035 [Flavobacterium sp. LAR06]
MISIPMMTNGRQQEHSIIDSLQQINPKAKVFTMGVLNDGPFNRSIKIALGAKAKKKEVSEFGVFNPFEEMANKGMGTIAFRDSWDIFDHDDRICYKTRSFRFYVLESRYF